MRESTKSWWRTFGWCVLLGAAGLGEVHRRDMRRIELTDARMEAYRAGQAHGARTEAARIAAEATTEDALAQLDITEVRRDATGGLRVTGYLPPGVVADAIGVDLTPMSVGYRNTAPPWPPRLPETWVSSEELDAAVAGLIEQLGGRRPDTDPTP